MARTANVFARVELEIKEQAEGVLDQFSIPLSIKELTKEEFNTEIMKGIDDIENGRIYSADEVEAEMRGMYSL